MIAGIGTDIIKIDRIKSVWNKFGDKFINKLLTQTECEKHYLTLNYIAGRWAAKEAAIKALGTGFKYGITFHDIEVLPNKYGRPELYFHNIAFKRKNILNIISQHISITHEKEYAHAIVILERK